MRTTQQTRLIVRNLIKQLPKTEEFLTYELMIYEGENEDEWDLSGMTQFKGIKQMEKSIERAISNYADITHIDFKFSFEEGEFDQFTIWTNPAKKIVRDLNAELDEIINN
jgi:hypothetical protein